MIRPATIHDVPRISDIINSHAERGKMLFKSYAQLFEALRDFAVYEIEGKLEVAGRFDFSSLISDKSRNFIPLFEAILTAILIPNIKVESPGILFNREQIDLMALVTQRAKDEK